MERRIDYAKIAPRVRAAMWGLEEYVHQTGLERSLVELVDLRASLIKGCAYCDDLHTKVRPSCSPPSARNPEPPTTVRHPASRGPTAPGTVPRESLVSW